MLIRIQHLYSLYNVINRGVSKTPLYFKIKEVDYV